jgi:hypothetical protein
MDALLGGTARTQGGRSVRFDPRATTYAGLRQNRMLSAVRPRLPDVPSSISQWVGKHEMKAMALLAIVASGLAMLGCGVSPDYVAVNAATIHTNSESTLATLEGMKCEAAPATDTEPAKDSCQIKKAALDALQEDQRQIKERAAALCAIAKSDCQPKP